MKIELKQETLNRALSLVSRVAGGGRNSLPILSNVLIKAENNQVSLTTTNLDVAIVDFVPVVNAEDGEITVPARLISEFVSNLPRGEMITLETDDIKVKISAGKYSSTINGTSAEDYPELPELSDENAVKFVINVTDFKLALQETLVAASRDTTRPSLTGVYFNTNSGILYTAASDGYRLACRKLVKEVESEINAIVPASSLQEVLHSISEETEEIELIFDDSQVRFRLGEIEITSKLIDGTFPDYLNVIPQNIISEVSVDRAELMRTVKMAAVFAESGSNRAISCGVSAEKQALSISSIANEMGENESEIETAVEADSDVKIDARFLMDAINVMEDKEVRLCFAGPSTALTLKNPKNDDYIHLVMPLSV